MGRLDEFDKNVESWECYIERVEQSFKANKITEEAPQVAGLITSAGSKKYKKCRDTVAPKKHLDLSYKEIHHPTPKWYNSECTVVLQRYPFHTSFLEKSIALRQLAEKCEFKTLVDEVLQDGLKDGNIQKELLGTIENF